MKGRKERRGEEQNEQSTTERIRERNRKEKKQPNTAVSTFNLNNIWPSAGLYAGRVIGRESCIDS